MAETCISGNGGKVTFGAKIDFGVTKWTVKRTYVNADITITTGSAWEEYLPICRGWTATIECPFDTVVDDIDIYFDSLFAADPFEPVDIVLTSGGASSMGGSYNGHGMLEDYSVDNSAKDAIRVTFTIRGTGALT